MEKRVKLTHSFVTVGLLILLLIVFLGEEFLGGSENTATLLKMGAMSNVAVVGAHQWWRLLTAQFLHIGILHLVSNAVIIYYMGVYLEPMLGHLRFLLIYLLSGIGGNLLSLAFGSDQALSAGASTALFGLFGAMTAIGLQNRHQPLIAYLGRQALVLALINLGLDIFVPNIDLQGHVGGLITGFLLAIIFGSHQLRSYSFRWRIVAGIFLVIYVTVLLRQGLVLKV